MRRLGLLTTTLLLIPLLPTATLAQETAADRPDSSVTMERLRMLAEPGPEHQRLARLAGTWEVRMLAGGQATGFRGTAEAEMILDGRFLVIDGRGTTGDAESASRYTLGFDRRHAEYVMTLMDTAGTYPVSARGPSDPDTGAIRMAGTDDDPYMESLGLVKKFVFEVVIKDKDEFSIETFYVDTRTEEEPLIPAFKYVFLRDAM